MLFSLAQVVYGCIWQRCCHLPIICVVATNSNKRFVLTHSQVPCQTQVGSEEITQQNCLELGTRSQPLALKGVKGRAEAARLDQEEGQALLSYSDLHPTNHKLVSSFFGAPLVLRRATSDFGLTRFTTAQTWGKPSPSPIQYSLRYSTAPTSEWHFFSGLPRRSPETVPVWTFGTLVTHNSLLRPPIGMRSRENFQLSLRSLQRCVTLYLHTPGLGRFLTFSGRESNCWFDSWPFFRT